MGWYIAKADKTALLVLHFDRGGKDDVLCQAKFLNSNGAENGDSFQVDNRAMSALCMNGLNGIAGSVVNDAVFDEQFAFDIVEVDWADYTMIDDDLGWCRIERMMLGFHAMGHERAM